MKPRPRRRKVVADKAPYVPGPELVKAALAFYTAHHSSSFASDASDRPVPRMQWVVRDDPAICDRCGCSSRFSSSAHPQTRVATLVMTGSGCPLAHLCTACIELGVATLKAQHA